MIFPLQTDSSIRNIRNYGCLLMDYPWLVFKKTGYCFSMREIEDAFYKACEEKYILDNDKPTDGSKGNWYRCWINNPVAWMKLLGKISKVEVKPNMLWKSVGADDKEAPYYIIEHDHRTFFVRDSHFTARAGEEEYNPGVKLGLVGIKSVRGWSL